MDILYCSRTLSIIAIFVTLLLLTGKSLYGKIKERVLDKLPPLSGKRQRLVAFSPNAHKKGGAKNGEIYIKHQTGAQRVHKLPKQGKSITVHSPYLSKN